MANFASIELEVTGVSDLNSSFQVKLVNATRSVDVTYTWICKTVRTAAFQFTQGADITEQTDNLFDAINADISNSSNSSWIFTGGIDDDTVTIEANEFGWVITDEGSSGTTNITPTEVPEVLPTKNFELTGYSLDTAVAPCSDIEVTITENDASGPAIAGAMVYGNWSGAYSGTVSGTADSGGKVSFRTSFIRGSGIVTFTVTKIVKNGQEYILSGETSESISGGR